MPEYTDQLSRIIHLDDFPKRIISLVPSQTELLYDLGLDNEVVAITKFCVHPKHWLETKTRIGGTRQLNIEKIKQLEPDLIIANKEENVKEQIELLSKTFPVWVSEVIDLSSACAMITTIGQITGKNNEVNNLVDGIQAAFAKYQQQTAYKIRTAYFIWRQPYMTVGGDTFINEMMKYAGFENIFSDKSRYPSVELSELEELNCEVLLLSSEPYPFQQKHIDEIRSSLPETKIALADGEFFSWYGSRLLHAPAYFQQLYSEITHKNFG